MEQNTRKVEVYTTDAIRNSVCKLLEVNLSKDEIAETLNVSVSTVSRIVAAIAAAKSGNADEINKYLKGHYYTKPNWEWAKEKYGITDEPIGENESGTATVAEVIIKQQRDILVETVATKELLEREFGRMRMTLEYLFNYLGINE